MLEHTTIAAIATPIGLGGVGMVRLSGSSAIDIADRVFTSRHGKRLQDLSGYHGALGTVVENGRDVDEVIAFVYHAPHSYTGEDVVEFTCHGGRWVTAKVLRICLDAGALPAEPGEYTKRAFLNGRIDLLQAESVMDVISAEGDSALRAAMGRSSGVLSTKIAHVVEKLVEQSAHLTAWADYPEEEIEAVDRDTLIDSLEEVSALLESLLATYDSGRILREGIHTAIVGKPNVGKSTLMNLLSGYESSIVTDIPGTTRDVVSETVRIGDLSLRLYDTAGLRDTDDPIERIGVARSREQMEQAQLIMAVFDYSDKLDEGDKELLTQLKGRPCLALVNKADLACRLDLEEIRRWVDHVVVLSAKTGEGYDLIYPALCEITGLSEQADMAVIANERQRVHLFSAGKAIGQALEALRSDVTLDAVGVCMDEALDELLSLTGERVTDRVLDEVFSRFCVGK